MRSGLHALVLPLLGAAVFGAACSPSYEDDLAAIAEFNERYLAAINEGDIDALAELTTEDHVMVTPGRAPMRGKENLVNAMRGAFGSVDIDETWTPEETEIDGDLAYQSGSYTVATRPLGGGEVTSETAGYFLRIYRRQANGEWRMVRDTFNSVPAGGQ